MSIQSTKSLSPAALSAVSIAKNTAAIGAFALALGLASQIKVPLPYSPVPVTMQTYIVTLAGLMLGARKGLAAVGLTLALGAIGAPFFAAASLTGATWGYLLGFIPMVLLTGVLGSYAQKITKPAARFGALWTAAFVATLPCLALGALWLKSFANLSLDQALALGVTPFIVGNIYKTTLAIVTVSLFPAKKNC